MDSTIKKICGGDVRLASRLIRDIEDKIPEAKAKIKKLYAHTGKSFIIGITGAPGAGKSTLTDALIAELRKKNKTIGVLAVDPTSPFTGGAILGDRIRMQRHSEDAGVFVRSLATRGALGGLSQSAGDAIHVLEAMGKDVIVVETVGIGQQEIDIINHAHSIIVVLVPGMGDEIQTMKAGLMEIADVFVINRANRAGANQLQAELTSMLNLASKNDDCWRPPIVMIGDAYEPATFVKKITELAKKIEEHHIYLRQSGKLTERMHRKAMADIKDALSACLLEPVLQSLTASGELEHFAEKIKNRKADPYSVAEKITKLFYKNRIKNERLKKRENLCPQSGQKKESSGRKKTALKKTKGLVMVITGNGKGKTTAAFGQALRAIGQGYRVFILQFMKGRKYGECIAAEKYLPHLTIRMSGLDNFVMRDNPTATNIELAQKGFAAVKKAIASGKYDMVILDEINVALDFKLIALPEVITMIKSIPASLDLILTGRYAPAEIIELADTVSEVKEVKHHYAAGIKDRAGIEY